MNSLERQIDENFSNYNEDELIKYAKDNHLFLIIKYDKEFSQYPEKGTPFNPILDTLIITLPKK